MEYDENEGIDWNSIADPDSEEFEDELLDEIEKTKIDNTEKDKKKKLLNLPIENFAKLPKSIQESCMVDDLLLELENVDDKRMFGIFCKSMERKYTTQLDRIRKFYRERNYLPGKYGEKRYSHKYHRRNVPIDYDLKAKYILDNLQVDYEKYKVCKQVRNGKVFFSPIGMTYEEMNELIKNIHCLSQSLKTVDMKPYATLVKDMYINGLSNIKYAQKYGINRGSVEQQKKKLFYVFAGMLAKYDLSQIAVDKFLESEDYITLKELEESDLKVQIFELLEKANLLK
jgi:hypothetical protein